MYITRLYLFAIGREIKYSRQSVKVFNTRLRLLNCNNFLNVNYHVNYRVKKYLTCNVNILLV